VISGAVIHDNPSRWGNSLPKDGLDGTFEKPFLITYRRNDDVSRTHEGTFQFQIQILEGVELLTDVTIKNFTSKPKHSIRKVGKNPLCYAELSGFAGRAGEIWGR